MRLSLSNAIIGMRVRNLTSDSNYYNKVGTITSIIYNEKEIGIIWDHHSYTNRYISLINQIEIIDDGLVCKKIK